MLVSLRRTKVKKADTFQFICMCVQGLAGEGGNMLTNTLDKETKAPINYLKLR